MGKDLARIMRVKLGMYVLLLSLEVLEGSIPFLLSKTFIRYIANF